MARPPKLTDEVQVQSMVDGKPATRRITRSEAVLELVRQGCTHKVAALRAGISEATFYSWRDKGRKARGGVYRQFVDALDEAEALAEGTLTLQMRAHAATEWRATAWMLERRFPDTWRERRHLDATVSNPAGGPVLGVVIATADMAPEQLAALSGVNLDEMDALSLPTDDPHDHGPGCAHCGAGLGKPHRAGCPTQD